MANPPPMTTLHPLEPLSRDEVALAVKVLKDSGKITPTTRFISVSLKEPSKAVVYAFTGKESHPREAAAVLFDNATNACFETDVSLTDQRVIAWKHIPGVQPTMSSDEQIECEQAVLASPEFKAALKRTAALTTPRGSWWISGARAITARRRTRRCGLPGPSASSAPTQPTMATPSPSRASDPSWTSIP